MSCTPTLLLEPDDESTSLDRSSSRKRGTQGNLARPTSGERTQTSPRRIANGLLGLHWRRYTGALAISLAIGAILTLLYRQQQQLDELRASPCGALSTPPPVRDGFRDSDFAEEAHRHVVVAPLESDQTIPASPERAELENRAFSLLVANQRRSALEQYRVLARHFPDDAVFSRLVSVLAAELACADSSMPISRGCLR